MNETNTKNAGGRPKKAETIVAEKAAVELSGKAIQLSHKCLEWATDYMSQEKGEARVKAEITKMIMNKVMANKEENAIKNASDAPFLVKVVTG